MLVFSSFNEPLSTVFTFKALPLLPGTLKFKRSSHRRSPKRSRPAVDVDDLLQESKKKRRLRLTLITSRLSRPFSTPATHCVDRGQSKIAVWAKQRHLAPPALRKAAIMNRVRRKTLERKDSGISVGEDERQKARDAIRRAAEEEMTVDVAATIGQSPNAVRYNHANDVRWSVPPSPLGLSNYDALDEEDDWYESYDDSEESYCPHPDLNDVAPEVRKENDAQDEQTDSSLEYFDFTLFHPDTSEDENPFHLSVIPAVIIKEKRLPSPPEDRLIELVKEQRRQKEITAGFLHFS